MSEGLYGFLHCLGPVIEIGDIEVDKNSCAVAVLLVEVLGELGALVICDICQGYLGSLRSQYPGVGLTHARGSSGDQCDFVLNASLFGIHTLTAGSLPT